jgi:TRAP-type C4-dicarboxylate transport system substrate-binding protein
VDTRALSELRRRNGARAIAAVVVATSVAGCGASPADKAGGSPTPKTRVLRLATHDDDYAYGTFAAAVARLSGGSLRITIARNWRNTGLRRDIDYEREIVADVRAGRVPLGIVGVRVWDLLGVDSFRALLAPFLVDSLALERRAVEGPEAAHALASVGRSGVAATALLPGRLRRPLGRSRPLVAVRDYRGATIGIRPGGVAQATFRALGATARGFNADLDLPRLDGIEIDPLLTTENNYDASARALTGNVVFWPKPQTIVVNRRVYGSLTAGERRILRVAGHEALGPELERVARDQRLGLSILCAAKFPIVVATRRERAALRAAVRPIYDELERDPTTRRWITRVARLKATGAFPADVARCPRSSERSRR